MGPIHETLAYMFSTTTAALTHLFFISTMLSIGLAAAGDEFVAALGDLRLVGRILLANIVFVPILGIVLVKTFPLCADARKAILLLALTPGGIQAIQFTAKIKGAISFAAAVLFLLSIIGIIFSPLLADFILPVETRVSVPYLHAMEYLFVFLLLPLVAGFAVRHKAGRVAGRLYKPILLVSNISFVLTIVLTMAIRSRATRSIGWAALSAMAVLIVLSMAIGWWLGGPGRGTRQVSAIATSMRNAGVCLLIAAASFSGTAVDVLVVAFMAMMVPPNMLFTLYHTIRGRRLTG